MAAIALIIIGTISLKTAIVDGGFWTSADDHDMNQGLSISDVSGFTKIGFTPDHIVVVNVLPGEEMYLPEEVEREHPTEGELILAGTGSTLRTNSRHVEAHVYDRSTGLPSTSVKPTIKLANRTTGEVFLVSPVPMHDLIIGSADLHFGDNVVIPGRSHLTVTVTISDNEEVVIDGFLE